MSNVYQPNSGDLVNGVYQFNVNYTQQGSSIVGDGGTKKAIEDTARVVTDTTKDTATSGFRDRENNFVYDNYSRVSNAAAVASLVAGNYDGASITHVYNSLKMTSSAETQNYLDTIGLGTSNAQNLNTFNNEVWYKGIASDGSTTLLQAKPGDDLYHSLLSSNGSYVSQTINGKAYNFSQDNYMVNVCNNGSSMFVSSADIRAGYSIDNGQKVNLLGWKTSSGQDILGNHMSSLFQSNLGSLDYQAERERIYSDSVRYSFTKSSKIESMERINQASLNYLKGTNPELKREIEKFTSLNPNRNQPQMFRSIISKLHNERSTASPARQMEIDKMLDALDKHIRLGGGNIEKFGASGGLSMQQRKGLQLVGNHFLGQDMMKGVNFYTASYKATSHAVKAISHLNTKVGYMGVDLGAGLVEKTLGKINPNIGHKASQARSWSKQKYSKYKDRTAAKKRGGRAWKDYQKQERLDRKFERQLRTSKKIKKNEGVLKNLDPNGKKYKYLNKKTEKLRKKLEKKAKQRVKKTVKKAAEKAAFEAAKKIAELVSDIASAVAAIGSVGADIVDDIKTVIAIIKWAIVIIFAIIIIGVIVHFLFCSMLVTLGAIIIELFSIEPPSLSEALNNRNFSQYIVDKTATELGAEFLNTAQNDAYLHYVLDFNSAVDSKYSDGNGTYWKKDTTEGVIGHIWAREECDNTTSTYIDTYIPNPSLRHELSGVNANLVPIMAMMNKRFQEEINFDNYCNAMAYVYTLYIRSHDKACFEDNVEPYQYNEVDDCDKNQLYSQPLSPETVWNTEKACRINYTTSKNAQGEFKIKEQCTNIYIHGYKFGEYFQSIAEKRKNAEIFFSKTLQELGFNALNEPVGTVILDNDGNLPSDSVLKDCDNIIYAQYSMDEDKGTLCGQKAHTHIPFGQYNSCYKCTTKGQCTHTHDNYCFTEEPYEYCPGHWTTKRVDICTHNCETEGCAHRCNTNGIGCDIQLDCGYPIDGHQHQEWKSKTNNGCYKTVAICAGHCGGHIEPVINLSLISTFEGLMNEDAFRQTYWMTESEMVNPNAWMGPFDSSQWSIDNWKSFWGDKASSWFSKLPRSPLNFINYGLKELTSEGAKAVDRTTSQLADIASSFIFMDRSETMDPNDDPDKNPQNDLDENGDPNDLYGFEGWFEDEVGTIDQGLLDDLKNMYGTMEENYDIGYENMELANIVIPAGTNKALGRDDIKDIFDKLEENGYIFTERQKAIVTEALDAAGMFWYQDTNEAYNHAMNRNNDCGKSDEVGMILGIVGRALDRDITSLPSPGGSIKPGTILSDGENYAIYIGSFANDFLGIEGFSGRTYHWIVECSKDDNGSIFKGVTANELSYYYNHYNY